MPSDFSQVLMLILLVLPLAAAVVTAVLGTARGGAIRAISLGATVLNLAVAVVLAVSLAQPRLNPPNEVKSPQTIPPAPASSFHPWAEWTVELLPLSRTVSDTTGHKLGAIQFHIGLDGLNIGLVALTALLMVSAVLISWQSIQDRVNEYYACLLLLETTMIGVFIALDIVLFYAFFELTLVPLFLLIGIWGGPQRQYAARKFFVYTLAGSFITLLGVMGIVMACYSKEGELTFQIPRLVEIVQDHLAKFPDERSFWLRVQFWVFLGLMAGFAIKVPLVPFHTWLPLAHVEAPTAGSVLLAGVLLKIGTYGFLRLCLPLAPDAALSLGVPLIGILSVIGILYGAFCALAQDDMKKMVAYSSVSHLGFCMLGMFALNEAGLSGSLMQMLNHGLSTGGLFLLVGMLYDRYHTRKMADYGGMASRLKLLACFMVFICLSSIGLPGLNGFIGELLVLMGMYDLGDAKVSGPVLASISAFGLLLGAWYLLTLLMRIFFGEVKEPHHEGHGPAPDMNLRELAAILPISAMCLAIGVLPQVFLDTARPDILVVSSFADAARGRAETARAATRESEDREQAARIAPAREEAR
jgi:NADH-quinone oxidoreductase subunit M